MTGYSKTGPLPSIRWPVEEIPQDKIPQNRAKYYRRATTTTDTKFGAQRKPANRRLPTTNAETTATDSRPILWNRPPTTARTRTTGNINTANTPVEEGEIGSETEHDPSVVEVPAMNWAKYVGVKSVQYIKMGHALRVNAEDRNN